MTASSTKDVSTNSLPLLALLCQKNSVIALVPIKVPSFSHITGKCWMRLGKKKKYNCLNGYGVIF